MARYLGKKLEFGVFEVAENSGNCLNFKQQILQKKIIAENRRSLQYSQCVFFKNRVLQIKINK